MAIPLEDLLASFSQAVANANNIIEQSSLNAYMAQGYRMTSNNNNSVYKPMTLNVSIPMPGNVDDREIKIPFTALMHNTTMRLEQVDVKLKFHLKDDNGKLMVICRDQQKNDESLNEMSLHFRNSVTPEGVAKMNDNYIKQI